MKLQLFPFFILLFLSFNLYAQGVDEKPEKIRYSTGFFNVNFEIGDKDATSSEVAYQMEKYSPKAYYDFKRGIDLAKQSSIWLWIGIGGMLVGTFSNNLDNSLLGYTTATVGYTVGFVKAFKSQKKQKLGIDKYNQKFGYR